jgi:acetylornithine deacetylase
LPGALRGALADTIAAAVTALTPELFAFAQRLVRTPSLPGDEEGAHRIVAAKLQSLGLDTRIISATAEELNTHPAFCDDGIPVERRINVVGRLRGAATRNGARDAARSLILNGHLDVVSPGNEALWDASPWSGIIRDGRLYGRGSCDMKSGLTAGIFAIETLQRLGLALDGDVLLESVSGEESGGVGTLTTIVNGYRASAAIVLEPTSLRLGLVQAGALTFRVRIAGRAVHACMKNQGVSAIEKVCRVIAGLNELERARHVTYSNPLYEDPNNVAPISIGTIHGGAWHSTVPDDVVLEGRFGVLPGESIPAAQQAFADALRRVADDDPWLRDHPPAFEWFEGQFESGQTNADEPVVGALCGAHKAITGATPVLQGVTYGSDLRLFTNHADMPAILYGPGDVLKAHTVNEFIELDEVVQATKVLALMMCGWCGVAERR